MFVDEVNLYILKLWSSQYSRIRCVKKCLPGKCLCSFSNHIYASDTSHTKVKKKKQTQVHANAASVRLFTDND